MARKKKGDEGGGYNWMDTYGDMVTLLLTFFVLLYSMSNVDTEKWEALVQAFSREGSETTQQVVISPGDTNQDGSLPAQAEGDYDLMVKDEIDLEHERPISLEELYEFLQKYITENNMEGAVNIEKDSMNNVYLTFDNNIFFDGDSATLRTESYPVLTFIGECLKGVEDQIMELQVAGHTASVAIENYPVNDWELSASRANRVVNFLETTGEFNSLKMASIGHGKNKPVFPNDTAENRAKNRRVEIMILGNEIGAGSSSEDLYSIVKRLTGGGISPGANAPDGTEAGTATSTPAGGTGASQATISQPTAPDTTAASAADGATSQANSTQQAPANSAPPAAVSNPVVNSAPASQTTNSAAP